MLTKDQAFDISEFIYKNGHESLWRVGDNLEKILNGLAVNPDKDQIISKFVVGRFARTVEECKKVGVIPRLLHLPLIRVLNCSWMSISYNANFYLLPRD